MRIPFDVKFRPQIESGEYKVETNDHHPVRIICWNKNTDDIDRIVALVADSNGREKTLHYTEEGWCIASGGNKNKNLFIVTPEPELTDFEIRLLDWLSDDTSGEIPMERMKEVVRNRAAELLFLAREQLKPEINAALEKAYRTADEVQYKRGWEDAIEDHREALHVEYEKGRTDALKDLPRWKKVGLDTGQTTLVVGYTKDEDKLYRNGYVISLIDLEKLPKEDSHE